MCYWLASLHLLFFHALLFIYVLATTINLEISMLLQSEERQQFFTFQGIGDAVKFAFSDLLFICAEKERHCGVNFG